MEVATTTTLWAGRRRRAQSLRERFSFAAELLELQEALLAVQEAAFNEVRAAPPSAAGLVPHIAQRVLPRVIEATLEAGPKSLSSAALACFYAADLEDLVGRWLRSEDQPAVDRYLARASAQPVLEAAPGALPPAGGAERAAQDCPRCGGRPQVAYTARADDPLVTGPRFLVCSRCSHEWQFPRLVCAACGEDASQNLVTYSETELLPHLSFEGCQVCRRYLVSVDLRRDAAAVPIVDELAALPLDLHAAELGLTKVVANLMGI